MEKLSDKIKMLLEGTGEVAFDIKSMGVTEPEVEVETIKESEDVRLSGEAIKTLISTVSLPITQVSCVRHEFVFL